MPPPLVVTAERSIVAVPRGDRPGIELRQKLRSDRPPPVCGIDRIPECRQLLHGNGVEADAVASPANVVSEWREHRLLPLAVVALPLAMSDSERCIVRRRVPQRAVA